jgi:CUB domain
MSNTVGCGEKTLQGAGGEIRSPGYPLPYPDVVECVWTIKVEHDMTIVLNFLELDLGPNGESDSQYKK